MADPKEVVDFMRLCDDAESRNRQEAAEDLRFRYGEQWPEQILNSRQLESRPILTINETDSYIRQVTNSLRQQRPRIKVHPVNDTSDVKVADVITGICRHIEVNSDAETAYDTACDHAVTFGFGFWRLVTDYTRPDSFDQDVYIRCIDNPFTVYFDPNSIEADGSDAERVIITDKMRKEDFRRLYPGADEENFIERTAGDIMAEWIQKEDIRIAEYFYTERIKDKLLALRSPAVPKMAMYESVFDKNRDLLLASGFQVIGDRPTWRKEVHWCKVTAAEVLEEGKWPGRFIPVVPVYGTVVVLDGRRRKFGMVRNARDPQMLANYWKTAATESIALAPKAKWLVATGADEGYENEYAQANVSARPVLHHNMRDNDGNELPPPQRLQPEPPPEGIIAAAVQSSQDLQRVMGIFDPAMGAPSGPKSGKAIVAEKMQSEQSNYHYFDNWTRSIKHTGRIILDVIPKIYDQQRVMRIIGDDGRPDLVTVNQGKDMQGVQRVLNDVTVGDYDVVMDTGPGFNTKRQEAVEMLTPILSSNEDLMKAIGDLWFRFQDFSGADVIADRLAAANPLAQIDEKSDIPPQVQMQMQQMQKTIQDLQGQLQQAGMMIKSRQDAEAVKQAGETHRTQMQEQGETLREHIRDRTKQQDVAMRDATKRHDTEVRAMSGLGVEELRALAKLLNTHLAHAENERQRDHDAEQAERAIASASNREDREERAV